LHLPPATAPPGLVLAPRPPAIAMQHKLVLATISLGSAFILWAALYLIARYSAVNLRWIVDIPRADLARDGKNRRMNGATLVTAGKTGLLQLLGAQLSSSV
jgi:hypothetical protein